MAVKNNQTTKTIDHERQWEKRDEAIQQRVRRGVNRECFVDFSAYQEDRHGMPVDNLDEVAFHGKVRFVQLAEPDLEDGHDYRSEITECPTWLAVAILANKMIKCTGDVTHRFLEGVYPIGQEGDVMIMSFFMGS